MKMSNNPVKYEVLIEQYLCSVLDISESANTKTVAIFLLGSETITNSSSCTKITSIFLV